MADQRFARLAEQLAERGVDGEDHAVDVHFEVAVAHRLEDRPVARLAVFQALEHLVHLARQLSQLVVAEVAQAYRVGVASDFGDLPVEPLDTAQDPQLQGQVADQESAQRDQQGGAEEEVDGLLALDVEQAFLGDVEAQLRLAAGTQVLHRDLLDMFADEPPWAEQGLVVGTAAAAAQRLPGGVGGDVGHRLQVGLHLFAEVGQAFPVEEVAGEDRALRRRATLVVADRHADQQGRQVVDQQQLAQAVVGASAKVQRAEADGALLQRLEQGLVARRGGAEEHALVGRGRGPLLQLQVTPVVEEQDEVETQVVEHLVVEVFLFEGLVGALDEVVAGIPPSVGANDVQVALQLEVQPVVQDGGALLQALLVLSVETAQQDAFRQEPDTAETGGQQRQEQPEQACA